MVSGHSLRVAVLYSLVVVSGSALAEDEEELPDLEFLEYLGSWDESDEDWLLFNELDAEPAASEEQETNDAEPAGNKSTESS